MEFLYSFQIPTHRTVVVVLHHCVSVAFYPAEMDFTGPALPSISCSSPSELLFQRKKGEGLEAAFVLVVLWPCAFCHLIVGKQVFPTVGGSH